MGSLDMPRKKIAVLPGDGVGPEVTAEAIKALKATGEDFEFITGQVGGEEYLRNKASFPPEAVEAVDEADAVLLGALGHESVPNEITREALVYLRIEKDTYANVRPLKSYPSVAATKKHHPDHEIDIVIIRDNAEGFSLNHEGKMLNSTASDHRMISNFGARRIVKFAFEYAAENGREKVTCVDQSNWLYGDKLFRKNFREVSENYTSLQTDLLHVDVAAMMVSRSPEEFDLIVSPGLYGDILSGIVISHVGGVGMAPSACIGDKFSFFEPVHGPAWDIAGKNLANPIASILSAKLMLEWFGLKDAVWMVETAVKEALEGKVLTPDIGGNSTTSEVGDVISDKITEVLDERRSYRDQLLDANIQDQEDARTPLRTS